MRRVVYQTLLRAPFKIVGAASGVAGFVGSIWPAKVKAVLDSGSFPVQTISAFLLGAAVIYFALLWWLKPEGRDEGGGTTQTTHGPHSPNYGTVRDVHNYFGPPNPAEKQPRKTDHWTGPRLQDHGIIKGLRQGLGVVPPKPDIPLNGVLVRVYKILGGAPEDQRAKAHFVERVDKHIADTVAVNDLHVWGRIGKRPIELIPPDRWQAGIFEHRNKTLIWVGPFSPVEYTDLCFNEAEVERHWPTPPETTK